MLVPANSSDISGTSLPQIARSGNVHLLDATQLIMTGRLVANADVLLPTQEFIRELAIDTIAGHFTSISFNSPGFECSGTPREIVSNLRGSPLARFQGALAQGLANWMKERSDELSVHGVQALHSSSGAIGFSSHCAKALPMHRDLAQFDASGTITLRPATFSLIAWGGRGGIDQETTLLFGVAPHYNELTAANESRLLQSRPELSILSESLSHEIEQTAGRVILPDSCVTVFGNHTRYHGVSWDQFRDSRGVNRLIDAQARSSEEQASFARPINVILL